MESTWDSRVPTAVHGSGLSVIYLSTGRAFAGEAVTLEVRFSRGLPSPAEAPGRRAHKSTLPLRSHPAVLPPLRARAERVRRGEELLSVAVDAAQDVKARRIVSVDLRGVEDSPAERFVICEGESAVQVRAIAENVRRRVREELGESTRHYEGAASANWVCLDYFDVVVHVFGREARGFYDLEGLWGDAPATRYDDL